MITHCQNVRVISAPYDEPAVCQYLYGWVEAEGSGDFSLERLRDQPKASGAGN